MNRRMLIAGNWKMNVMNSDGLALAKGLADKIKTVEDTLFEMLVCPPYTLISSVIDVSLNTNLSVGAQNCHTLKQGPHTGDISAAMLKDLGCYFDAFTSHDDEITVLPDKGIRLSGNDFTSVQSVAVSYKNSEFWAVQYHPEYDLHEMARLMFCRMEKLIKLNFFKSESEGLTYINQLELLHNEPSRSDMASELKVKSDILDDSIRTLEVKNWINHLVLPSVSN